MEEITKFVAPELLVLIPVLYFIGKAIMNTESVKDEYVPYINGVVGIVLSALYVVATKPIGSYQEIAMAIFVALVQGFLCAGCATYYYELKQQKRKLEMGEQ